MTTNDAFSELRLRETVSPNRIMLSPMCQYSCETGDGIATDWHFVHLGSRAVGGAGIVMTEMTAVESQGRISPQDLGIWSQDHANALAPITDFIRTQGSVPGIQLGHAGRKGSKTRPSDGNTPLQPETSGWETIGPTDTPYPYTEAEAPPLRAMDQNDIEEVIDSFANAARLALDAGFEIAEIHAAHGYLLHQFLSPVTNTRSDDYGGRYENRIRLTKEVTTAVREVWPDDQPLFVRISATDWLGSRESWTVDQSIELADQLAAAGADLIDVSAGGLHRDQDVPRTGPSYQLPYAEQIRQERSSAIKIGTVGGITTPEQAEEIILNDRADLVIIGREHLRDPYFTLHATQHLGATDRIELPRQYRRGL